MFLQVCVLEDILKIVNKFFETLPYVSANLIELTTILVYESIYHCRIRLIKKIDLK